MSDPLNPFSTEQLQQLKTLLSNTTADQRIWLSGYLSGLSHSSNVITHSEKNQLEQLSKGSNKTLTILYGTHTGHSEKIARKLGEQANQNGIITKIFSLEEYKVRDLNKEENLALIVSTHGEGEPPLMAEALHEYVKSGKAKPINLKYAVLALGDRSYKYFCKTGIDFDESFLQLGGNPILPIVKCDVDFETDAAQWINELLKKLSAGEEQAVPQLSPIITETKALVYSKQNPFFATVLDKRKITGRNSDKEVWHVELSLEGSGLEYEPGDALGVFTSNPPELAKQIIDFTGLSATSTITIRNGDVSLYEALYHHFEITVLNRKVLEDYSKLADNKKLNALLLNEQELDDYLYGHDFLDLLHDFPSQLTPHQLVSVLRYLPPRLYSISSSVAANPDEVHITVAKVNFDKRDRKRKGACSTYLAEGLNENEKVPVYIEKNINFRLPNSDETPVIMIGAGTGIAPYRAFIQDFENRKRKNNSWLFFGDRTFTDDFLYQVEWQKYLQKGILGKLDLAFSRDQQEKVYVQHKLLEKAPELFQWLNNGAHLYICGDRKKMFNDVQNTLIQIIRIQGGITEEKAKEYLKDLQRQKRYQTDVY